MARITVEDCLENVENRFELVMVASKRARQLQTGGREPLVSEDNDKPTVLALREIAQNLVNPSILIDTAQEEAEDSVAALEAAKLEAIKKDAASASKNDISIEDAMDAELVPEEAEANTVDSVDIENLDGDSD